MAALAKGSKKEKSSFGGALDLFYLGPALILFRPRAGLHLLTAFTVEESWPALRHDLHRFYLVCHLAEILTGMTREEEPLPEVFDLVVAGGVAVRLFSAGEQLVRLEAPDQLEFAAPDSVLFTAPRRAVVSGP